MDKREEMYAWLVEDSAEYQHCQYWSFRHALLMHRKMHSQIGWNRLYKLAVFSFKINSVYEVSGI